MTKGSIKDVGNVEVGGSKICQTCRRKVLKKCRNGIGGVEKPEKNVTSFIQKRNCTCTICFGCIQFILGHIKYKIQKENNECFHEKLNILDFCGLVKIMLKLAPAFLTSFLVS